MWGRAEDLLYSITIFASLFHTNIIAIFINNDNSQKREKKLCSRCSSTLVTLQEDSRHLALLLQCRTTTTVKLVLMPEDFNDRCMHYFFLLDEINWRNKLVIEQDQCLITAKTPKVDTVDSP